MSMTKNELVKAIIRTENELADNFNTEGFDWNAVATDNELAKRELAERFNAAVGYGGIIHAFSAEG